MDRRASRLVTLGYIAVGLFIPALGAPTLAPAQPARSSARIGVVRNQPPTDPMHQAFVASLRERGWVEGRNLTIDYRQGEVAQFPGLVRELVRRNVDVIFAPNPQQARLAKDATTTIPVVFAVVGDAVGTGLVKSLARPGANVTGLTGFGSDLGGKRLEILKEIAPRIRRVAVLWNPAVPDKVLEWNMMQDPARTMGLELRSTEVRTAADFPAAFESIMRVKADALITLGEPLTFSHRTTIIEFAQRARLPTVFNWRDTVPSGGLVAYGPSIVDLYRRAAIYVDKILRGARPADLPVEQPVQFELAINLKTAKALGLTVPPSLLLRADQIVE